jgi:hypothetical protein
MVAPFYLFTGSMELQQDNNLDAPFAEMDHGAFVLAVGSAVAYIMVRGKERKRE